jgi:C4-dicarboxylate-specific signal transduction histidine kinase
MQIKFIGVPGEDHESLFQYGHTFRLGEYVEVTDAQAIRKLSNHPHFSAKVEPVSPAQNKQMEQELQVLAAAALEPLEASKETDHGNAQPVGDTSASEAQSAGGERSARRGRPRKGG